MTQRLISLTPDIMSSCVSTPAQAQRVRLFTSKQPCTVPYRETLLTSSAQCNTQDTNYLPFIHGGSMLDSIQPNTESTIADVLQYLERLKALAVWHNDRAGQRHYEECVNVVFEAITGLYTSPVIAHAVPLQPVASAQPATKPRWFIDKFSHPMRRVVRHEQRRCRERVPAGVLPVSYDVLSCGHEMESDAEFLGVPPAKHRRCRECVRQ